MRLRLTKCFFFPIGNQFNELDVVQLVEAFEENKTLVELDLSHNCFGEECGKILGTFIGKFQIIYFQKSISVCEFSW